MLSLVQRVFWNPISHEENKNLPEIRTSELVAAATLVVAMVWIGVRPNDVLRRIQPSLEALRTQVASSSGSAEARRP
jgi:NADH-quinone oxidoreductase subunit M